MHAASLHEVTERHGEGFAFLTARPGGPLGRWIEAVWYSHGALPHLVERVLPSATGDLVLNLGPPMARIDGPDGPQAIVGGTVSGLFGGPMVLRHPTWHRAVGLRLRPFACRALLGVPTGALNDAVVDLSDVVGPQGRAVTAACTEESQPRRVVVRLLTWLANHMSRRGRDADAVARWTADRIEASGGRVPIRELVRESGYGNTQFIRRFRDELGVTPKAYASLVRFRAALDRLGPGQKLAELALATGFTDQSHMGAEFRRLAGRTPTQILAARYPSGLTVAED